MKHNSHLVDGIAAYVLLAALFAPRLHAQFGEYNFNTPENVGDLIFNFFHHSVGGDLLDNGLRSRLEGLGYTLHAHIGEQYIYENDHTDYRHWYKRFQRELGVKVSDKHYRYEGPGVAPTQEIPADEFMLTWYEYLAERMDIIMFKPCYPGAEVSGYDTVYDAEENVIAGTPHSDNGVNNFVYLNSSDSVEDGYTDAHWSHGDWWGADSSLAQLKVAYRGMLNIFVEHPDLLFIAMQGPPMVYLSDDQAENCREFARWLREDWLDEYDPTGTDTFEDYPLTNVCAFDFHNAIAWTGNDPVLDAAYAWFPAGGFPDDTLDTTAPAKIGRSANDDPGDDHLEPWLDQRTAVLFCGGTDTYSGTHNPGYPQRTYNCWINAMVNRWKAGAARVPRPIITKVGNTVSLIWQTFGEGQYTVQWVKDPVNGTWQNAAGAWPTADTSWAGDDITGLGTRYYRVMSQ